LPSTEWTDEGDDSTGALVPTFGSDADSECVYCSGMTDRMTAEMLYMSQGWDYYYCYQCRGWFKRHYADRRVFLAVKDRAEIRHLTWFYTKNTEYWYEQRRFLELLGTAWRVVEKRLPHVLS